MGRGDAVLRHQGHRGGPVRRARPDLRRDPLGVPRTRAAPATDQAAAVTGAFRGALEDADPNKQKAFIESITSGSLVNEAQQGAESALAGILGRMAAYTGKEVTWDQMMKSKEVWDPKMDWKQFA
ncbi:MAG TPA: hypothetical protein VE359_06795 [Vicinamibacteria bacterium]|nr:hypothetical protein [Vicinamibacteria bacterium]